MNKTILVVLLAISVLFLTACSGVSQSYADKINEGAVTEEYISLDDAREKLGDDLIEFIFLNSGVLIAAKGIETQEELQEKLDAGETVKGIVITVFAGNCISATYREIENDDID